MTTRHINDATDFVMHESGHDQESKLVHWHITAQCFLAQLDTTATDFDFSKRSRYHRESVPFLRYSLRRCSDCIAGIMAARIGDTSGLDREMWIAAYG